MEINKMKKAKLINSSPAPRPSIIRTVDELNNQGKKLINKLNHDCLAQVLMHLPVLERLEMEKVCQKWKEAAEFSWYNVKKLDWNDLLITLDKRGETLEMIMKKCGRYLTHLTIIGRQYPWMSYVLKDNCQNIINFSIKINNLGDENEISNEDLVEIIQSMPKLKYLKVKTNATGSNNYFTKILDKLPEEIEEIHLTAIFFLESRSEFAPVLNKFKALRCLSLKGFNLTNETLEEGILQNKNTLSKLNLSQCTFPSNALPIFTNLKNLEHLNLYHINNFNVNEIISIAHNCQNLKYFKFETLDSDWRTETIPYRIFNKLKYLNLNYLNFRNIDKPSDDSKNIISGIANNWRELKYLKIKGNIVFSPLDLQEITKFKNLEYLNIYWAEHMDSQLFINIASNCLELKVLDMYFHNISEAALESLANLKKLEILKFEGLSKLNDNLLIKIANNCKNLVDLNLCNCKNITEVSLLEVGKLQNLKTLNIDFIKNVPNEMFYNFKKLEWLTCRCCSTITDEAVIKVIDNCPRLWYLNVAETGITRKSRVYVNKRKFVFRQLHFTG